MGLPQKSKTVIIACIGFVILRILSDYTATFFEVSPGISIWYPPCGLALAFLHLFGLKYTPVVLGTNLAIAFFQPTLTNVWLMPALAVLNTVNYAATAWVARRYMRDALLPGEGRSTLLFTLIIALSPATMAITGSLTMVLAQATTWTDFWPTVLNWWVGDVSGLLTIVPPIMVYAAPKLYEGSRSLLRVRRNHSAGKTALQIAVLIGVLLLVFAWKPFKGFTPFYLCFLPLIWICFCHGLVGATLATLVITMSGLIGMHFAHDSTDTVVVHFLFFELAMACVGLGLGTAVSRRDASEKALLDSQAESSRHFKIIEATTDYIATADEKLRILYANTALLRLSDAGPLSTVQGQPLGRFFPPEVMRTIECESIPAALRSGAWHGELTLRDGARVELPVSTVVQAHTDSGRGPVIYSFVLRNIASQKQAEAERLENERRLQQVQKLESLGVLAGGIAHDFNNLLTPLLGYASLARLDLPESSPVQQTLNKIEQSAERAATLCQQMLAYAGKNPPAFGNLDLSRLIEETAHLLRVSAGKKRALNLELAHPINQITADPVQIRQVLMNLVLNASEAIGERLGAITLRTREETVDRLSLASRFHGSAPEPGVYVVLEVEDDGCGMTPEVYARIFEPYFSTKFAGHGLGLAAVHGIIRSHRGSIQVRSVQGQGTLFRIYFPALIKTTGASTPPFQADTPWRGSGRALVVDDEPDVRAVMARALEVSGFKVTTASDGVEALEMVRANPKEFRLVLLDLTMPRMDGEQAFREIHAINRAIPVILMSGYSEKLTLDRFVDAKPAAFLSKPFDYRTLQNTLRRIPSLRQG